LDETHIRGTYDWTLLFDEKHPESIIEEIRKELGLELRLSRSQVEYLVAEPVWVRLFSSCRESHS